MKRLLLLLGLMAAMPLSSMEQPYKSNPKPTVSKLNYMSKLPALGVAGLYGFVGLSAYSFVKNIKAFQDQALAKLYKNDFNALGVKYSDRLEFETPDFEKQNVQRTYEYRTNAAYLRRMAKQFGPLLDKHYIAPLYLTHINKEIGYGVFADENIEQGQMIGEYTAVVRDSDKFNGEQNMKEGAYSFNYGSRYKAPASAWRQYLSDWSSWFGYGRSDSPEQYLILDAYEIGNETRFVNHSYKPNIKAEIIPHNDQWHVVYIAKKPIAKNEQLFIDYGYGYWVPRGEPDETITQKYRFNRSFDALQNLMEHTL